MRDAFFFLSIAGLGVSVAGFAGLMTAFRKRDQGWTRAELWRLRAIPRFSFTLVFLSLAPFPLYSLLGQEELVVRIVSGLVVLVHLYDIISPRFDMASWPGSSWHVSTAVESAVALVSIGNIFAAQTGLLEVALLVRLVHPIDLFMRVLGYFEPTVID